MLKASRNQRLAEFSSGQARPTALLLGLVFGCGLIIAWMHSLFAVSAYGGLWALSYFVIYAGACRTCVYYGKKCPIPLEGSCVNNFFEKKAQPFGFLQLFWATVAYGLRVILPLVLIFRYEMIGWGIAYFSLLALFWIIHLRFTGCPNCINAQCPLNPDHR